MGSCSRVSERVFGDLFYTGPDKEILLFPRVGERNESSRKGVHLIGEVGGTPLLKNGLNQGAETVKALAEELKAADREAGVQHLVIIGAGAAGMAAAFEAKAQGLSYVLLEQSRMAETVQKFHKHKPIFAEPTAQPNTSRLWFDECIKEELLEKWAKQVDDEGIEIQRPVVMKDVFDEGDHLVVTTDHGNYKGLRVLLAIGKSGNPRRLGIPGEDLDHVHTSLGDPDEYQGKKIAIIGAGDSAVEMALALCEHNEVTLLVRRDRIDRPKKRNRDLIHEAATEEKVTILYNTSPKAIAEGRVECLSEGAAKTLEAEEVFLALGFELPLPLLRKLGVKLESDWDLPRIFALLGFTALIAFVYLWKFEFLKGSLIWSEDWGMWGSGGPSIFYRWVMSVSEATGGIVPYSTGMWFGAVYSVLVAGFGSYCIYKYRKDPFQVRRYVVIMFSQIILLWILPEILFQGVLAVHGGVEGGWRAYGLVIPAPLYMWNFKDADPNTLWLIWFVLLSFLGVPLYSKYTGKMYCSWVCGCGCLAETFGDQWRHLAPRGRQARAWELLGEWAVLGLASFFVIMGILGAAWGWTLQMILVDFFMAGVIGVASYPFLGNRIWCRFLCPLSRVMHVAAGNTSKRKISGGAHCIECGLCSKYCQMGIPVMEYARNAESFDNKETSCIQCGICVTVCPVRNLQHMEWDEDEWKATVREGAMANLK